MRFIKLWSSRFTLILFLMLILSTKITYNFFLQRFMFFMFMCLIKLYIHKFSNDENIYSYESEVNCSCVVVLMVWLIMLYLGARIRILFLVEYVKFKWNYFCISHLNIFYFILKYNVLNETEQSCKYLSALKDLLDM